MPRSPRARPRLALIGALSIAFVLLPAVGIAYFGAISYQEDRGLVAARIDQQYQASAAVAAELEATIERALDQLAALSQGVPAAQPSAEDLAELARAHPLAAFPFILGKSGRLVYPAAEPLRLPSAERDDFPAPVPRTCPERGFDTCILAMREARRRSSQLEEARRREMGPCATEPPACTPSAKDLEAARRAYVGLARFDDTGPDALLGLARMAARAGDKDTAATHYRALAERFGSRVDADGASYRLLAELGTALARADAASLLRLYQDLVAPTFEAPSPMLEQIAARLGASLADMALTPDERALLERLDARLDWALRQTLFATALAGELDDIAHSAGPSTRGRPALTSSERTIIYRGLPQGLIIGVVVDTAMLERAARRADPELAHLAPGTRAAVERPGDAARRAEQTRTLASTGFGPLLPHLSLSLVHERDLPDPLDAIIEARGRRHLAITGGLAVLLVIGLIATIRSAARERELARLKSDFVSTVSHELKTPLTSIRMFGEMLQQGVAGDDRERQAHYHDIIVKESQRLGLLIANLLDYSQIERSIRRYSAEPAVAADIAGEAVDTFERFREGDTDLRVHLDEPARQAKILVDREVLVQSLLNLLENAAKYGAPPIEVTVSADAAEVAMAVADHGPGIAAGERERIFREFYRSPAAYSAGVEGTGLGLALVKRHVEAQGGRVAVAGEVGRGAVFSIHFPRY